MWTALSAFSLLLAVVPFILFIANLREYRRLPNARLPSVAISVLIPARNEQTNIGAALDSVLHAQGTDLEVIVLDDHSTDNTAAIVASVAARDSRVRLITGEPIAGGWCGKNFACHQLGQAARHSLLVFMDADVRVSGSNALARLAQFVEESGAALVSGVPRQETRTFLEKVIVPLIHFVLLGFLPLRRMRATTDPRFAAACGQILAVTRDAYQRAGGHAPIRGRIHDAVALARHFRVNGLRTDLFDATDTFHCRMYSSAAQVWNGFAKNAHEGLGSRVLIVPSTLVLLGGQVTPFAFAAACTGVPRLLAEAAIVCCLVPRLLASAKFQQPMFTALLHPLAITLLVAIQWYALLRRALGRPVPWKSRLLASSPSSQLA